MSSVSAVAPVEVTSDSSNIDSGLEALCLLVTVLGERLDPSQLRHEYLEAGKSASADDLVRIAHREGYKARQARSSISRLGQMQLPAIGIDRTGAFFIIAKVTADRATAQTSFYFIGTLTRSSYETLHAYGRATVEEGELSALPPEYQTL